MKLRPEDLRRWVFDQRAAASRQIVERREAGGDPVSAGLELAEFAASIHGWPLPEDGVRVREVDDVRARWVRLRRAHRTPAG